MQTQTSSIDYNTWNTAPQNRVKNPIYIWLSYRTLNKSLMREAIAFSALHKLRNKPKKNCRR